jgi:hypothetical protein
MADPTMTKMKIGGRHEGFYSNVPTPQATDPRLLGAIVVVVVVILGAVFFVGWPSMNSATVIP